MSLYNMLHGVEPSAAFVLLRLGITASDVPRFRDAYVTFADETKASPVMVLLTRTGGDKRPHYLAENIKLRELSGFINDHDDEFDETFALFRYDVPQDDVAQVMKYLTEYGPPKTLREKTEEVAKRMV